MRTRVSATRPVLSLIPVMLSVTGLASGIAAPKAHATQAVPFKVASIHFETNASACDMGIQVKFDSDGVTSFSVVNPKGTTIYQVESLGDMKATGGQTEGFLEGIEPQVDELKSALGCAPSDEEGTITLENLFAAWPAGRYTFKGAGSVGTAYQSTATLSHVIPAGPQILTPAPGTIVSDTVGLQISWSPVTEAILTHKPNLGPVNIIGYHVIVEENIPDVEVTPEVDVDLDASQTSLTVPEQYLSPNMVYRFEVLSTDQGGNQTLSEGFFCTNGVATCVLTQ